MKATKIVANERLLYGKQGQNIVKCTAQQKSVQKNIKRILRKKAQSQEQYEHDPGKWKAYAQKQYE